MATLVLLPGLAGDSAPHAHMERPDVVNATLSDWLLRVAG
jgi:hypothetical protein